MIRSRTRSPLRRARSRTPSVAVLSALLGLAALVVLPIRGADAHGKSVSYSTWRLTEDGAEVTVRVSRLELSRLPRLAAIAASGPSPRAPHDPIADYLAEHVQLTRGDEACGVAERPHPLHAQPGAVRYRWRLVCPTGPAPLAIRSSLLLEAAPSHLHFARVLGDPTKQEGGAATSGIGERVLTEAMPVWKLARADGTDRGTAGTSLGGYVALGIEHILSGWDHLAFVLGLILLSRRVAEIARLITGFTLAHSLTLAFAVLGWVRPQSAAVEAVIGFSVALVAAEYIWWRDGRPKSIPGAFVAGLLGLAAASGMGRVGLPIVTLLGLALFCGCYFALQTRTRRPETLRILLTFAFGLVHGFGFAGVLMAVQLPTERLVPALFGFNAGVELGQLGVVCMLWPLLRASERIAHGRFAPHLRETIAAGIAGVGVFWFVSRSLLG